MLDLEKLLYEKINKFDNWKHRYLTAIIDEIKDYLPIDDSDEDYYNEFMSDHGYDETFDFNLFTTDKQYANVSIEVILNDFINHEIDALTLNLYPNSYKNGVPIEILYDIDNDDVSNKTLFAKKELKNEIKSGKHVTINNVYNDRYDSYDLDDIDNFKLKDISYSEYTTNQKYQSLSLYHINNEFYILSK